MQKSYQYSISPKLATIIAWHSCKVSSAYATHFPLKFLDPAHVYAQVMSSNSIKVSWTPAPTASNVSVAYYINASSSTYQTVRRTVSNSNHQVVISGLHPFTEYYISVQAGNPGGLSAPTVTHATTLTAGQYLFLS